MKKLVRNPKWAAARYEWKLITEPSMEVFPMVQFLIDHPVRGDELDADGEIIPIPEFIEIEVEE